MWKKDNYFSLICCGLLLLLLTLSSCNTSDSSPHSSSTAKDDNNTIDSGLILPHISSFNTAPSDTFLVNLDDIVDGHMYRGKKASSPHSGAHVNFKNTTGTWPTGGIDSPQNYPPIYAIADGTVTKIDTYYPVTNSSGTHYRYGITLEIATSNTGTYLFSYSIEPMTAPDDETFYEPYIKVAVGDTVTKGDIIAYMYLSTADNSNAHIHFNMLHSTEGPSTFIAPIIFTDSLVDAFAEKISTENGGIRNYDGNQFTGTWMGNCLGYMLDADENPFSTGEADCIK